MRNKFFLSLVLSLPMCAFAQEEAAKVSTQSAFEYNRCSITVLPLHCGSDNSISDAVAKAATFDDKFDMNELQTSSISSSSDQSEILQKLVDENVGKQALNYWLNFDGNNMSGKIWEDRAEYNMSDQEAINATASKVDAIKATGVNLMKNTYIMVTGPTSIEKHVDKKGNVTYTSSVAANVYRVDLSDSIMTMVFDNWVDTETPAGERAKKLTAYQAINPNIEIVSGVQKTGAGATPESAVTDGFNSCFFALEKKIEKWQVVTSIYEKHPLGAKIGKKEGLHNSDRYRAFKLVEDADGNLTYKKMGYVRATRIADNSYVADGNAECSNFYQISGKMLREGMFLKQKKDMKMGVNLSYNLPDESINMVSVDIDYLIHTSQVLGMMQYAKLDIGFDSDDKNCDESTQFINAALGYGIGIHPIRTLEIMPYAKVGADYTLTSDSGEEESDEEFMKKCAYFGGGGIKVGFQVFYPVSIYVKGEYNYVFSYGEQYGRPDYKGGLSIGAGVRVAF